MTIYLMRHGDYMMHSPEQVLSARGIEEVTHVATFLKPRQLSVSNIFHSSKIRAQQTAEIIAPAFLCEQPLQLKEGLNPNDDIYMLANEIIASDTNVCYVGHLPFMSRLLGVLVVENENHELVQFHTGTMVCLEKVNGRWGIDWVIHPNML